MKAVEEMKSKIEESSPNPLIQSRARADYEARNYAPINNIVVQYHYIKSLASAHEIDIMKALTPIDEQWSWVGREIEYLLIEQSVIDLYIINASVSDDVLGDLRANYLKKIAAFRQDSIEGYKTRLSSRDYFFEDDKFIKLTGDKKQELIEKFTLKLGNWLEEYTKQFYNFNTKSLLFFRAEDIKKEINKKKEILYAFDDQRVPIIDQINTLKNKINKITKDQQQAISQKRSELDQSLPSLCFRYDLEAKLEITKRIKANSKCINEVNQLGELPLHRACEGRHIELIRELLSKGAKPELLDKIRGLSAYHYACMSGLELIMKDFYAKGGDNGLKALGIHRRSLLHSAVFANKPFIIDWLLSKNVLDINAKDEFLGDTPLHIAAWLGYDKLVGKLIGKGANPKLTNNQNETAIFKAALYLQTNVLIEFLRHGFTLSKAEIDTLYTCLQTRENLKPENARLFAQCIKRAQQAYQEWYHYPLDQKEKENISDLPKQPAILPTLPEKHETKSLLNISSKPATQLSWLSGPINQPKEKPQLQLVLQGKLPNTNNKMCFEEQEVAGYGDCGFIALGVTRSEVKNKLTELKNDKECRAFIKEEIYNALMANEITLTEPNDKIWEIYSQEYMCAQTLFEASRAAIVANFPALEKIDAEDFINWLRKNDAALVADSLEHKQIKANKAEGKLKNFCADVEVYQRYIELLGQKQWIGCKSAILYAKYANISLYIWHKGKVLNEVVLYDYHESQASTKEIHMLFTYGFSHYNLLKKVSQSLELSEQVNPKDEANLPSISLHK